MPDAVHHLPDGDASSTSATRPAGTATRCREQHVRQCPYTTCRMVPEQHVRYETRCVMEQVPQECVRHVPVTTCRMVCEQRQQVVRQCRVNYVCEERVRYVPQTTCKVIPGDVLHDGAGHDLLDGAVHGDLLREAVCAGVRADLPPVPVIRPEAESEDRNQESAKDRLLLRLCLQSPAFQPPASGWACHLPSLGRPVPHWRWRVLLLATAPNSSLRPSGHFTSIWLTRSAVPSPKWRIGGPLDR